MRIMLISCSLSLIILSALCGLANADALVGVVKSAEGGSTIERNGKTIGVVVGTQIQKADIVRTDRQGYVGLVFSDDTSVSMGPNTELVVEDYLFEPLNKKLSFVMRLVRGTISYLSGQISKLSSESVRLITPEATIGVRGTHVLLKVK